MPSVSRTSTLRRDVVERKPHAVYRPAVERRGTLVEIMRAVNTALDPPDGLIHAADMAMDRVKPSGRTGIQAAIAPTES